jgi:hypothetical protein
MCENNERKTGTEKQFPLEGIAEFRKALERKYGKLHEAKSEKCTCSESDEVCENCLVNEEQLSESQEEYQKFFQSKLEKFGVKSPAELSVEKKKEFFTEIEEE